MEKTRRGDELANEFKIFEFVAVLVAVVVAVNVTTLLANGDGNDGDDNDNGDNVTTALVMIFLLLSYLAKKSRKVLDFRWILTNPHSRKKSDVQGIPPLLSFFATFIYTQNAYILS